GAPRRASPWLEGLKCGHLSSLVCTFAGVTCPPPTSVEHADIRVKSYKLNSTERYTCNTGFKRKAGTSTLTECVLNKTTNTAHWTIPNLKCIKPAFTSKSDSTVATKAATEPGSRLIPSKPPAAGTTGVINNEPSRAPAQTTAKALEHTPSASQETPGYPGHSATLCLLFCATASLLCSLTSVLCLGSVSWKRKQTSQIRTVAMENMEEIPMTGGTNGRDEDAENQAYDL
uniref:Interleukin-15 receptor subunit alpha n=1 Tax=Panthera tigris altaica TaxID=74533 RepID=A0A8C9J8P7_PANTA